MRQDQPQRDRGESTTPIPSFYRELELARQGYRFVAGLDEVGRGCLAGPVVAAAVIMPLDVGECWGALAGVRDSKQLTPARREQLCEVVRERSITCAVGAVDAAEIDAVGIVAATRLAMVRAVAGLSVQPDYLLIDCLALPELDLPQCGIVHGDALCFSIAAASIVAKVWRDRLMARLDSEYGGYGFARHKGYGTAEHLAALARLGVCPLHRHSFRPVTQRIEGCTDAL